MVTITRTGTSKLGNGPLTAKSVRSQVLVENPSSVSLPSNGGADNRGSHAPPPPSFIRIARVDSSNWERGVLPKKDWCFPCGGALKSVWKQASKKIDMF